MSDNRKSVNQLTLLFTIAYFISYITRINYSAVIIGMVTAEGITKTVASGQCPVQLWHGGYCPEYGMDCGYTVLGRGGCIGYSFLPYLYQRMATH